MEIPGGHKCDCPPPLKLKADGQHCEGEVFEVCCLRYTLRSGTKKAGGRERLQQRPTLHKCQLSENNQSEMSRETRAFPIKISRPSPTMDNFVSLCVFVAGALFPPLPSPPSLPPAIKPKALLCIFAAVGLQLTCDTNSMKIELPRNLIHNLHHEHLRLIDPNCGAESNASFYSLSTSHTDCGTTSRQFKSYIVYSNKVMEMPNKDSAVVTSVGEGEIQVPFSCYYLDREIVTAVGFKPTAQQFYVKVKGRGNYKLNLNFYKDDSYGESRALSPIYTDADFPVKVRLRERLYFEASLDTREKDLRVFASNCCSTPTHDHEATHKFRHALIVEG